MIEFFAALAYGFVFLAAWILMLVECKRLEKRVDRLRNELFATLDREDRLLAALERERRR